MTRKEVVNRIKSIRRKIDDPTETQLGWLQTWVYLEDIRALNMVIEELEQESCEDCVSRQKILDSFLKLDIELRPSTINAILNMIDNLPPVTSKEPKTRRWINNHNGTISCDYCHAWFHIDDRYSYMKYCPNCGAKMERGE